MQFAKAHGDNFYVEEQVLCFVPINSNGGINKSAQGSSKPGPTSRKCHAVMNQAGIKAANNAHGVMMLRSDWPTPTRGWSAPYLAIRKECQYKSWDERLLLPILA